MMVVDKKKAPIVKDIFQMTSNRFGYREICKKYKLKPQSYYNIIRNEIYIGIIEFKNEKKQGVHEHIINKDLFEKVNSQK